MACRSASSTDSPSVATSGFPPCISGSITSAASVPWNAPAASSARERTSSRSIEPASSPKMRLRRPSSSARSRAPASSRPSSSIRSFRLATTSATRSSVLVSERHLTTSRANRSTTRAPKPTLIPVRSVVIEPPQRRMNPPTHCSGPLSLSLVFVNRKIHPDQTPEKRAGSPSGCAFQAGFGVCEALSVRVPCFVRLAGPAAPPTVVV